MASDCIIALVSSKEKNRLLIYSGTFEPTGRFQVSTSTVREHAKWVREVFSLVFQAHRENLRDTLGYPFEGELAFEIFLQGQKSKAFDEYLFRAGNDTSGLTALDRAEIHLSKATLQTRDETVVSYLLAQVVYEWWTRKPVGNLTWRAAQRTQDPFLFAALRMALMDILASYYTAESYTGSPEYVVASGFRGIRPGEPLRSFRRPLANIGHNSFLADNANTVLGISDDRVTSPQAHGKALHQDRVAWSSLLISRFLFELKNDPSFSPYFLAQFAKLIHHVDAWRKLVGEDKRSPFCSTNELLQTLYSLSGKWYKPSYHAIRDLHFVAALMGHSLYSEQQGIVDRYLRARGGTPNLLQQPLYQDIPEKAVERDL